MDFLSLLRSEREKAKNKNSNTVSEPQPTELFTASEEGTAAPSTTAPPIIFSLSSLRPIRGHKVAEHVLYIPDFLSVVEESTLLSCLCPLSWQQLKTRRLQCWHKNTPSTVFPSYLQTLVDFLVNEQRIFAVEETPNHVLINQYSAVQGILHHTGVPNPNTLYP